MQLEPIIKQLEPWWNVNKRSTWKPIVKDGDAEVTASKFGGMPWLAENETFPCCGECGAKMPLFLQLDLNNIPAELENKFGHGLLQMFYCLDCDSYMPLEHTKLVRIIQPMGNYQTLSVEDNPSFPAKTITGWSQLDDSPNTEEAGELGLHFNYNFKENTIKIECPSVGLITEDLPMSESINFDDGHQPQAGDKLAGYPLWVQGIEYPNCPECNRRMELVFQLDSEDNLPYMFGDVGCGHITQCPEHKHILTFGWACG